MSISEEQVSALYLASVFLRNRHEEYIYLGIRSSNSLQHVHIFRMKNKLPGFFFHFDIPVADGEQEARKIGRRYFKKYQKFFVYSEA